MFNGSSCVPRRTYSRNRLLQLRDNPCLCPSRVIRRKLFYFNILTRHIPTIISNRTLPPVSPTSSHDPRERCLLRVKLEQTTRAPRREAYPPPSLLLSNVQSISNKLDEVALLLSRMNPDVAVFTETWLDETCGESAVQLRNYTTIRKDRANGRGGGIVCFVRDTFSCCLIGEREIPSLVTLKSELLCVFIKELFLVVISIYHPFWNDNVANNTAISCLVDIVDYVYVQYSSKVRIVLCGDFNDLRHQFSQLSSLTNLSTVVNFPTRADHILDQIFVNFSVSHHARKFPPLGSSDHCVVFWSPSPTRKIPATKRVIRKFSASRLFGFRSSIANIDWIALITSFNDLDDAVACLINSLVSLFDYHFPSRTVRFRSSDPEWMKGSLKILIDDRDRAFSDCNWAKYYRLREKVKVHTRSLKNLFLTKASSTGSAKSMWKAIRCVGRTGHSSSSSRFDADDFNDFFSSNFASPPSSQSSHSERIPDVAVPVDFVEVSVTDVFFQLRKLKNKGSGCDNLSPWIFKDCAVFLAPVVTLLLNRSLREGHFPKCLKLANVIPIQKSSHPSRIEDFRPISMLPVLSKVFERAVLKKFILPRVTQSIHPSQFAYIPRPGTGTTSALVLLYHQILEFLDTSSGAVRVLSIDFSKAFDKLSHTAVLDACSQLGLNSLCIEWIKSFLSDRMQRVVCGSSSSSWTRVTSGVPQGSVLGPILFCLVIDRLSPVCSNTKLIKYADDVVFLHFLRSSSEDKLHVEWKALRQWSSDFLLPINYAKCKVMDIVTKRNVFLSPIPISPGVNVPSVSSFSFLGVTICNDLKWNTHFDNILRRAVKRIYIMRNLRRSNCSADILWKVYDALLRSVLIYCSPCFCNASLYLFDKIIAFERRVCRIMNISPDSRTSVRCVMDNMCKKLFNQIVLVSEHPLRTLFEERVVRRTRSMSHFMVPRTRTERFKNSFVKYSL